MRFYLSLLGLSILFFLFLSPRNHVVTGSSYETDHHVVLSLGAVTINQPESVYIPIVSKPREKIFFDDFSDPSSGWPVSDQEHGEYRYVNGEYEISLRIEDMWSAARAPIRDINNYAVAADMRLHSGRNAGYGLIFELVDWDHFYLFIVFPESQGYALFRFESKWVPIIPITHSNAILQGSATNHLEIKRVGSEITILVNGAQLDKAGDSSYLGSDREVGLYIESSNMAPIEVRFDNFTVWQEGSGTLKPERVNNDGSVNKWWSKLVGK